MKLIATAVTISTFCSFVKCQNKTRIDRFLLLLFVLFGAHTFIHLLISRILDDYQLCCWRFLMSLPHLIEWMEFRKSANVLMQHFLRLIIFQVPLKWLRLSATHSQKLRRSETWCISCDVQLRFYWCAAAFDRIDSMLIGIEVCNVDLFIWIFYLQNHNKSISVKRLIVCTNRTIVRIIRNSYSLR